MDDPREDFLVNIALSKSYIHYEPSLVLLFGGEINIKDPEPTSIREMLVEYCADEGNGLNNSIRLAEHYKDWYENQHYDNLLKFEEDLSQLATLVVIILESAGTIAELGAFCVNKKIKNNLVIAMSEKHFNKKSFITLGPLKQLDEDAILAYSWKRKKLKSTVPDELPILVQDIEEIIKKKKTQTIDLKNIGHLSYLAHELIIQFKALTSREIKYYFSCLEIETSDKEIKKILYLLGLLELVKSRKKGNKLFFLAKCKSSRIAFSGHDPKYRIDEAELHMSVMRYYANTDKEDIRHKIIFQEYKLKEEESKE